MIRVAPEGRPFIAGAAIIWLALVLTGWWGVALAWLPVALWVVAFFRDPDREGPRGDHLLIAPADGKVVAIVTLDEPEFLKGRATRVSIFMNVFDVHVNRYPIAGTVEYRRYLRGRFGHAATEKSSEENEQAAIGISTARGRVLVRQIAGLIARRIVTDHEVGTVVQQGERMGMIRFGSRVDLFFPQSARVLVRSGDRVRAGLTVVAQWDR